LVHHTASHSVALIMRWHLCTVSEAARGLLVMPTEAPLAATRLRLHWARAHREGESRPSGGIAGFFPRVAAALLAALV